MRGHALVCLPQAVLRLVGKAATDVGMGLVCLTVSRPGPCVARCDAHTLHRWVASRSFVWCLPSLLIPPSLLLANPLLISPALA